MQFDRVISVLRLYIKEDMRPAYQSSARLPYRNVLSSEEITVRHALRQRMIFQLAPHGQQNIHISIE